MHGNQEAGLHIRKHISSSGSAHVFFLNDVFCLGGLWRPLAERGIILLHESPNLSQYKLYRLRKRIAAILENTGKLIFK